MKKKKMQFEIELTAGDLAWGMKDEDPETIVEFIRDFFDHTFSRMDTKDLVQTTVNFLCQDHDVTPDI